MAGREGGRVGGNVRANAEAQRIAAEYRLGRPVKLWRRGSKVTERVLAIGFLIGLPVVTAVLTVTAAIDKSSSIPAPGLVALGVVLFLPVVIAFRGRLPVLYEFEGGVANVSRYRRRVTVVRWADLAAVTEDIGQDQDGDWHTYGWLLKDHAGNTVHIGKRTPQLKARAEQILADRVSRPYY